MGLRMIPHPYSRPFWGPIIAALPGIYLAGLWLCVHWRG